MADEVKISVSKQSTVERYHEFLKNYTDDTGALTAEEKCVKLYDNWTTYEEDVANASYSGPSLASAMLSELCQDKNISILDCGAGSGLVGEQLRALGFTNLTGNDISQTLLDIAEKKNIYKKLICCDGGNIAKLPFEENEFDALICAGCVSPTSIRPKAFIDWTRVVKPGGVFLLVARHRYWQTDPTDKWPKLGFKEEFDTVIQDLETSKKVQLIFKKVVPDYIEGTEGLAFAFRVL